MNISNCIQMLNSSWHGNPSASEQELGAIETRMNIKLPADFRAFMAWSNGGVAKLPSLYLVIWEAEKIISLNLAYKIQDYLGEKVLAIGSDGGPICFLLDFREEFRVHFSSINFGDLDPTEIKKIAPSFSDALAIAIDGTLKDDEL